MITKSLLTIFGITVFLSIWPTVDKFTKARFETVTHALRAR